MLEEAKKRDHRKIGTEMELFCFDDDVGPGLPLWLPKGTVLIEELEKLAKETEFAAGLRAGEDAASSRGRRCISPAGICPITRIHVSADGTCRRRSAGTKAQA